MEKFANDLDQVLDDFDFNKDLTEQVASLPAPQVHHGLPISCGISNVYHQPTAVLSANNVQHALVSDQECMANHIDNTRKLDVMSGNFYTHEAMHDCNKLQHKQCMDMEAGPSPLTIHNDISQRLLQKRTNESSYVAKDSPYDKILNHPNLQMPSVSNVYNSLNEYTHPNMNMAGFETPGVTRGAFGTIQHESSAASASLYSKKTGRSNTDCAAKFSVDELLIAKPEELPDETMEPLSAPPKYQNILLPVKVDASAVGKFGEGNGGNLAQSLEFPKVMTSNHHPQNTQESSDKVAHNTQDQSKHVYENVFIGTDIPKAQSATCSTDLDKVMIPAVKHTYQNVELSKQNVDLAQSIDNSVPEYINPSNKIDHESGTVLKHVINNVAEHMNLNSTSASINRNQNTNVDLSSSTKLVFQNVQLDHPETQIPETKPAALPPAVKPISFHTIDDMSEEELNQYLADLEAEEKAKEEASAMYENVLEDLPGSSRPKPSGIQTEDEDADEAPIFEAVTIGVLPQVPQEDLQAKAKKFAIIDYSLESFVGETSQDSASVKVVPDSSRINVLMAHDGTNIDKMSKRVHEKMKKNADDLEPISHDVPCVTGTSESIETDDGDKFIGPSSTMNDCGSEIDSQSSESAQNENMYSTDEAASLSGKVDNLNSEVNGQNTSTSCSNNLADSKTIPKTETISRFSVTRNVDVNDKLGCRSKSSHSHRKKRTLQYSEGTESDDDSTRPSRPQSLDIVSSVNMSDSSSAEVLYNQETSDAEGDRDSGRAPSPDVSENSSMDSGTVLGKQPPFWVPDSDAPNCMLCDLKFTVMKRRHHCRACGKVLCNKCCNMRYRLEYQNNVDSRVCIPCHQLLTKAESDSGSGDYTGFASGGAFGVNSPQGRQPNPNNPMEYCSTIPPLQQLAGGLPPPPTVMVPVGVLKREGSTKQRPDGPKSVMFSDGIRPGCDLTELDTSWDWKPPAARKMGSRRLVGGCLATSSTKKHNCPPIDPATNSYIPQDPTLFPPTVTIHKGQVTYHETTDPSSLHASLKNECEPPVMFAINRNLYAYVKIIDLNCCVNKVCWNVTSKGLACVGQDELVFLVETLPDEKEAPKDLFLHINQIYHEALKGMTISEYCMSIHQGGNLLGSREHAGFLFIRQTLQCLQKVVVPPAPFLVGLLVHRWETPWAKVFPLRLVLRLGAEYRYYPCPLVSVRFRDAVYFEIGHTIMKVLADFRNFAYTVPKVQGMTIHMQDKITNVRFPKNRFNQVMKGLNNSNDHVLAFAANFSIQADSHLVCMQTNSNEDESVYQTQAINIQNKPRKVTGASFIVINGALKSSMGLSANSSILEDGLMVQIMPEKMEALKAALKNMQDFTIGCGRQGAPEPDEIVNIKWVENDTQFNLGIKSPIDGKSMDGIPSIRVHNGINFVGTSRFIRWTEVFIIKLDDEQSFGMHYPVDINKLSESIARATCAALVKLLDLLANAGLTKIAVRTTIHPDNVGYEAGSEGTRLPPIYMNSLDNELIQVLQKAVQGCEEMQTVLELVFYVLETEN
ncbi:hypothetical protein QAD02_023026 [Eretmocerus hayati]|uniref:Uncharacterized protein n=1 Tax=Eretmocerus hayati TaxID=131215 RepID=A0ACC2PUV5_9HYME|nr:hypothetical protein QAD02_023026 [Eretmocerus hayati]